MKSIHGHKVLNLIKEQAEFVSRDDLLKAMEQKFGTDACFHTCSVQNLNSEELVSLFLKKGKLEEVDNLIQPRGCNCGCH